MKGEGAGEGDREGAGKSKGEGEVDDFQIVTHLLESGEDLPGVAEQFDLSVVGPKAPEEAGSVPGGAWGARVPGAMVLRSRLLQRHIEAAGDLAV